MKQVALIALGVWSVGLMLSITYMVFSTIKFETGTDYSFAVFFILMLIPIGIILLKINIDAWNNE